MSSLIPDVASVLTVDRSFIHKIFAIAAVPHASDAVDTHE